GAATALCGSSACYKSLLDRSDGSSQETTLTTMWKGNSAAAIQTALNITKGVTTAVGQSFSTGDNHFQDSYGNYQIGLNWGFSWTPIWNAILMDPNSSSAQKTSVKQQMALYANIIWDNDFFPIDQYDAEQVPDAGLGNANQLDQYHQYRANIG